MLLLRRQRQEDINFRPLWATGLYEGREEGRKKRGQGERREGKYPEMCNPSTWKEEKRDTPFKQNKTK